MRWYINVKTGEVYESGFKGLIRYSMQDFRNYHTLNSFAWIPYSWYQKHPAIRIACFINGYLCEVAIRNPKLWRPCSAIARFIERMVSSHA